MFTSSTSGFFWIVKKVGNYSMPILLLSKRIGLRGGDLQKEAKRKVEQSCFPVPAGEGSRAPASR
jgi:hypothetical protein